MDYARLIGKAEAIVATGMPGLYRVVAFIGIQRIYSLSDLGKTASAFSVAQILAFFTAIGWASLILVRIPAVEDQTKRISCFYDLLGKGLGWLFLFASESELGPGYSIRRRPSVKSS